MYSKMSMVKPNDKRETLNDTCSFKSKHDDDKTVKMKKGIPLVSKMRSPIFWIGVLYTGSSYFSTDHQASHSDAIAIGF